MDAKSDLEMCVRKLQKLKSLKEKEPNNTYHDWDNEIAQCEHNIAECVCELQQANSAFSQEGNYETTISGAGIHI